MENKKRKLWLSYSLRGVIQNSPDPIGLSTQVLDGIDKAKALLLSIPEKHRAWGLFQCIDKSVERALKKSSPSCKKGCTHCCHIAVTLSDCEARRIARYVKEKNIPFSRKRLISQSKVEHSDLWLQKVRKNKNWGKCVFLTEKGTCAIYPVRPGSCRLYHVASSPELCDPLQDSLPTVLVCTEAELFLIAMLGIEQDQTGMGLDVGKENENMSAKLLKLL